MVVRVVVVVVAAVKLIDKYSAASDLDLRWWKKNNFVQHTQKKSTCLGCNCLDSLIYSVNYILQALVRKQKSGCSRGLDKLSGEATAEI